MMAEREVVVSHTTEAKAAEIIARLKAMKLKAAAELVELAADQGQQSPGTNYPEDQARSVIRDLAALGSGRRRPIPGQHWKLIDSLTCR
jgi:hypothetical protein